MSKQRELWLKYAEEAKTDEARQFYLDQAEEQVRREAAKRGAEEARILNEAAKRRRLQGQEEIARREEQEEVARLRAEYISDEQRLEMKLTRLRRNMEANPEIRRDPLASNAVDIKHLFRLTSMFQKTRWLQVLWPYIDLASGKPTHRIYTRTMKTFCLHTTLQNRAVVLEILDKLDQDNEFLQTHMMQELMFDAQNIMPFFDLEPKEKVYMDNMTRRSSDMDAGHFERPEMEMVLAMVAGLFANWPALAWIVWKRESDTGARYHIRVRGLDGVCVLIDRHKLKRRVELGRLQPTPRCKVPTRDWLGLDHRPYDGQMRFSNSIKCDDPTLLARDAVYGTDSRRRYTYVATYRVEMGVVKGVLKTRDWPYHPTSSKGACSLPFGTVVQLVPQRVRDPSQQDIVSIWQSYAASLPKFKIPLHSHLEPRTFSWNWRPGKSMTTALHEVSGDLEKDAAVVEWKRIANYYCRVIQRKKVQVLVLTPQQPQPQHVNVKDGCVEDNQQFKYEVMERSEFEKSFSQEPFKRTWKEGGERKTVSFAQVVLSNAAVSIDSIMWRQYPMQKVESRNFNMWCGPGVTPDASIEWVVKNREKAKDAVHLFLEHLMWLCGNRHHNPKVDRYNMWAFTTLLHFTRKVMVDPFDRHAWEYILIIQGEPGCGKGTYWRLLQTLVSLTLTHRVEGDASAKRQAENFNAVFAKHLLTLIDEPTQLPMELINSLKTMASEAMVGTEQKYENNEMGQNLAHVLIFFNKLKELPKLDQGERRIIITEGLNHPQKREFFNKVYKVVEGEKGYHAIAAYLYSLEPNKLWESTMGTTPYVGPLKAMMLDHSKPAMSLLLSNARVASWNLPQKEELIPFLYKPTELDDAPMAWKNHLDLNNHTSWNYWIWETMGDGFDAEWPPFVPLSGLVKLLWGVQRVNSNHITKMKEDLIENLKTVWPSYVSRTWPLNQLYSAMEPVVELTELTTMIRDSKFKLVNGKLIHRGCALPEGISGTCCAREQWRNDVVCWYPWHEKNVTHSTMSGKVLLLPRKQDAEVFYLQLFSIISDIPSVHFPKNWQLERWRALVDALGSEGNIEPLDEDDEASYLNFEPVNLGQERDIVDRL